MFGITYRNWDADQNKDFTRRLGKTFKSLEAVTKWDKSGLSNVTLGVLEKLSGPELSRQARELLKQNPNFEDTFGNIQDFIEKHGGTIATVVNYLDEAIKAGSPDAFVKEQMAKLRRNAPRLLIELAVEGVAKLQDLQVGELRRKLRDIPQERIGDREKLKEEIFDREMEAKLTRFMHHEFRNPNDAEELRRFLDEVERDIKDEQHRVKRDEKVAIQIGKKPENAGQALIARQQMKQHNVKLAGMLGQVKRGQNLQPDWNILVGILLLIFGMVRSNRKKEEGEEGGGAKPPENEAAGGGAAPEQGGAGGEQPAKQVGAEAKGGGQPAEQGPPKPPAAHGRPGGLGHPGSMPGATGKAGAQASASKQDAGDQDFGRPGEIVRRFDSKKNIKNAKKNGIPFIPEKTGNTEKKSAGIPTTSTDIEPIGPDKIKEITGAEKVESYIDIDISGKKVLRRFTKAGKKEIVVQEDIKPEDIRGSARVRKSRMDKDDE